MSATEDSDVDPRRLRSRNRLLDAAAALLKSGGLEAITVEAVTKLSKVAKTTLYRHFDNAVQLRAATIERLLPPAIETPAPGPLRERLIALLERQFAAIRDAPLQVTTLAWLATGTDRTDSADAPTLTALRQRLIDQYSVPFNQVLDTPEAQELLGDLDVGSALAQLVGPLVFTKLIGIGQVTPADCARIVDDFLYARTGKRPQPGS
ncbi:TetR/AcrR family transcriptional regulator [Nocardia sp. XZ_19_385]|uniref:TetR/AcrR family transcriptional regulator n=1 Tax=Nocardia sp. XZ_19_385 TaxID=2769488 RepID=UPI001E3BB4C5|nr:TetR/AcrR family transcriptional regulator [Nocardia sp. XZ_19_385]